MERRIFNGSGFVIIVLVVTILTFIGAGMISADEKTQESGVAHTVINVQFDTGQADVKGGYQDDMKKIADIMTKDSQATAVIEGYTDSSGQKSVNLKLSKSRAESVKKYLVETLGVDAARLKTIGYGPSKPIASNATAEGRQKNRRVAVVIKAAESVKLSPVTVPVIEEKTAVDSQVTGLIVDAFDMKLNLTMTPAIYNEGGQEIYGKSVLEVNGKKRDCVMTEGFSAYAKDISDAKKRTDSEKRPRVGSNPLIVKGIKTVGTRNQDIVISDDDAKKIVELEEKYHFLQNCKVVIVLDPLKRK